MFVVTNIPVHACQHHDVMATAENQLRISVEHAANFPRGIVIEYNNVAMVAFSTSPTSSHGWVTCKQTFAQLL